MLKKAIQIFLILLVSFYSCQKFEMGKYLPCKTNQIQRLKHSIFFSDKGFISYSTSTIDFKTDSTFSIKYCNTPLEFGKYEVKKNKVYLYFENKNKNLCLKIKKNKLFNVIKNNDEKIVYYLKKE